MYANIASKGNNAVFHHNSDSLFFSHQCIISALVQSEFLRKTCLLFSDLTSGRIKFLAQEFIQVS